MNAMKRKELFASRWGIIFTGMGMAVGTGNIWRFPRIVSQQGSGAFIIAWILFLFLWSIPLLIIEISIGKKTRLGVIGSFRKIMGGEIHLDGNFCGLRDNGHNVLLFGRNGVVFEVFPGHIFSRFDSEKLL